MEEIKAGDVVELKSGGPRMTVDSYSTNGNEEDKNVVLCCWFDVNMIRMNTFSTSSLRKVYSAD
jgi:uncharacterized protein YodC (DUF2158 family)